LLKEASPSLARLRRSRRRESNNQRRRRLLRRINFVRRPRRNWWCRKRLRSPPVRKKILSQRKLRALFQI